MKYNKFSLLIRETDVGQNTWQTMREANTANSYDG